jgi:Holliday junction DNA helicase RuvA
MIRLLRGRLVAKEEGSILLMVGGIGFQIFCPAPLLAELKEGEEVELQIHFLFREEGPLLFGFRDQIARALFELLLSVNGVGPRVALNLLASQPAPLLARALQEGDLTALQRAPGVGRKLAERISLELRGKIPQVLLGELPFHPPQVEEAELALLALGFREGAVRSALASLLPEHPQASAQELVKLALRILR